MQRIFSNHAVLGAGLHPPTYVVLYHCITRALGSRIRSLGGCTHGNCCAGTETPIPAAGAAPHQSATSVAFPETEDVSSGLCFCAVVHLRNDVLKRKLPKRILNVSANYKCFQ